MSLPELPYTQKRKEPQIVEFKGVNYREGIRDGELQACENMSSRRYPFLSPRRDRLTVRECQSANAIWAGDKLVLVDDGQVLYDGILIGYISAGPKEFAAINSKLVIWPDKVYVDLNTGALKHLEAETSSASSATTNFTDKTVTMTGTYVAKNQSRRISDRYLPASNNTTTETRYIKVYDPEHDTVSFANGVWTLTGGAEHSMSEIYAMTDADRASLVGKIVMISDGTTNINYRETIVNSTLHDRDTEKPYDANSASGLFGTIRSVAASHSDMINERAGIYYGGYTNADIVYDVIAADGLSDLSRLFSVGDVVTVKTGSTTRAEKAIIRAVSGNELTFDDGTFTNTASYTGVSTISRDVPDLDYICASENRLWGVSNADEGRVWNPEKKAWETVYNRVIYASALGDPTNFYTYAGLSTDSYAVAVAGPGDFTGCVGFSGDVLLFKERRVYRIYGDYPASYTLYTYDVPGVAAGSNLSCGIINDVLYYLAKDGVHAWSGGESQLVSYKLGPGPFSNGVAGVWGTRYYLSMQDGAGDWSLHVYDALHNVWYREDGTEAKGFAESTDGRFYLLYDTGLDQVDTEDLLWRRVMSEYNATLPQKCRRYTLTGPLSAGTYHFTVGNKTYQFTATSALSPGRDVVYCPALFSGVRLYRYNDDGLASVGTYAVTEGTDGAALPLAEQDVVYRLRHTDGSYTGYMTLPEDLSGTFYLTVDSKRPERVTITKDGGATATALLGLNKRYQHTINISAAWREYHNDSTWVTVTDTYYRYTGQETNGDPLQKERFADWTPELRYGLQGLDGITFQMPKKIIEWIKKDSIWGLPRGVRILCDTRNPGSVTIAAYNRFITWTEDQESQTVKTQTGTADTVLPASVTSYGVQREEEVVTEIATWVNWRAVLADADEVIHQRKNYRWLRLRLTIPAYSTVRVLCAFDGGEDRQMWEATPEADFEGTVNIPLPPNRTDKIRVTLEGAGDMTLKSVIRAYNVGSVNTYSKGAV